MAIGDNMGSGSSYQGNNSKTYEPTYYSRLRISRSNDLSMSISYRSGLMIISIDKFEDNKTTSVQSIYLSPMKAYMLSGELKALLEYRNSSKIDAKKAFGVNAGMNEKVTFIGFSTDSDKKIYCTIGKFDGTGTITESTKFEFAYDYHYSLEWKDIEANDLEKVYNNDAEILCLLKAIEDFARSTSGALGYGTLDLNRYEKGRENRRMDQVFDKLGIERRSYNGGNFGSNNFLSNAGSTNSRSTSFEDVEDLLA